MRRNGGSAKNALQTFGERARKRVRVCLVSEEVLHFCLLQVPRFTDTACVYFHGVHAVYIWMYCTNILGCVCVCLGVQVGGGRMYQVLYILTPALYQLYLMSLIKIHEFLMQIN